MASDLSVHIYNLGGGETYDGGSGAQYTSNYFSSNSDWQDWRFDVKYWVGPHSHTSFGQLTRNQSSYQRKCNLVKQVTSCSIPVRDSNKIHSAKMEELLEESVSCIS